LSQTYNVLIAAEFKGISEDAKKEILERLDVCTDRFVYNTKDFVTGQPLGAGPILVKAVAAHWNY